MRLVSARSRRRFLQWRRMMDLAGAAVVRLCFFAGYADRPGCAIGAVCAGGEPSFINDNDPTD